MKTRGWVEVELSGSQWFWHSPTAAGAISGMDPLSDAEVIQKIKGDQEHGQLEGVKG